MGCWYKTCGISNLHIPEDQTVYTFVLLKNESEGRCYNNAHYNAILVPFECEYDDYGGGRNARGSALKPLMTAIKNTMVISVDELDIKDNFNVGMFFDMVHDGDELMVYRTYRSTLELIDFVMMRKDIVDNILDNWEQREYIGCPIKGNYLHYKYADVIKDIPEFIDILTAAIDKHNVLFGDIEKERYISKYELFADKINRNFTTIFKKDINPHNLVSKVLHNDMNTFIFNPNTHIFDLINQNASQDELVAFITDYIKGMFVNRLIDSTRKQWIPGGHEGSQNNDHSGYRALIAAMTQSLDIEAAKWDND